MNSFFLFKKKKRTRQFSKWFFLLWTEILKQKGFLTLVYIRSVMWLTVNWAKLEMNWIKFDFNRAKFEVNRAKFGMNRVQSLYHSLLLETQAVEKSNKSRTFWASKKLHPFLVISWDGVIRFLNSERTL